MLNSLGISKTPKVRSFFNLSLISSEANSVQLQLVLVVPEDFDTPSSAEWCKEDLQYLELSEVIRVKVQPKAKC